MTERRSIPRARLRVVHFHSGGPQPVRRVSELLFRDGRPLAVLRWIGASGERRPELVVPLETARLRPARRVRNLFRYDGMTSEPSA
jgi:hypothetical protein